MTPQCLFAHLRDVNLASASASDIPFLMASCSKGMCFSKEYRDQVWRSWSKNSQQALRISRDLWLMFDTMIGTSLGAWVCWRMKRIVTTPAEATTCQHIEILKKYLISRNKKNFWRKDCRWNERSYTFAEFWMRWIKFGKTCSAKWSIFCLSWCDM